MSCVGRLGACVADAYRAVSHYIISVLAQLKMNYMKKMTKKDNRIFKIVDIILNLKIKLTVNYIFKF